ESTPVTSTGSQQPFRDVPVPCRADAVWKVSCGCNRNVEEWTASRPDASNDGVTLRRHFEAHTHEVGTRAPEVAQSGRVAKLKRRRNQTFVSSDCATALDTKES